MEAQDAKVNLSEMIFVFGSNRLGKHFSGAARTAVLKHGAIITKGEGIQGTSYALPTKLAPHITLSLEEVSRHIDKFIQFAQDHPELEFQVTQVGCGLAGFTKEEIAPLFRNAPDNCFFDSAWDTLYLLPNKKYWGTYEG